MDFPTDDELLEGVKRAIRTGGGTSVIAARTGIPVGTLNKYVAGTSMPSLSNAVKIADAAGMSLTELAVGKPTLSSSPVDVATFTVAIFQDIHGIVDRVHREEAVALQPAVVVDEARRRFADLLAKLEVVGDLDEARALLPWLENRIRKELREAASAPGTGKREAS